ncbi:MAG: hypothetical protein N2317_01465 [Syntrophales bacterium]|nr:hypothetical protein [Syntrophales bacterium]
MRKKFFLFTTTFFIIWIVSTVKAEEGKWRFIGFTRFRDALYVDMTRTKPIRGGTLNVWSRIKPAKNNLLRKNLKKDFVKAQKSVEDLSHIELQKEINCSGDRIRHLKIVYFDKKGNVLLEKRNPGAPWQLIKPGSLWEALRNAVCETPKTQ